MAAATLEASEKARELTELGKKLVAAEKAAEKLRQALKKLERERDARPLPEALVCDVLELRPCRLQYFHHDGQHDSYIHAECTLQLHLLLGCTYGSAGAMTLPI